MGRRKCKLKKIILASSIFGLYFTMFWIIGPDKSMPATSEDHPIFHTTNVSSFKRDHGLKLILIWTRIQGSFHQWGFPAGSLDQLVNKSSSCPNTHCVVTYDKKYLEDSDAVIFSWYDLKGYLASGRLIALLIEILTFGLLDIFSNDGLPAVKQTGQKYVLYWAEPPNILERYVRFLSDISQPLDQLIDWTVSYRRDSTFYHPYCYSILKSSSLSDMLSKSELRWTGSSQPPLSSILPWSTSIYNLSGTVKILWFVSNCHSASKRESFVKLLKLEPQIQVDVFGACGDHNCDKSSMEFCYKSLVPKYHFYLSLENEVCPDYFTEKLCNILGYDIVPIVLGGADYSEVAPPHSVIDVREFSSVPDLAEYLRYLVANPDAYQRYFSWKATHRIEFDVKRIFACDLCHLLHLGEQTPKNSGFSSWFHKEQCESSWKDLLKS